MSRIGNFGKTIARGLALAASMLTVAHAQYVGRVDTNQNANKPVLRATAVLEYTGDVKKPIASRLIPIAVWDGERYQPGGLYLAQPVPLTVESGTQYQLQVAGQSKGFFDVKAASDVNGSWIAIGAYQKPPAPPPSHLHASRHPPQWVTDANDERPHFAHRPSDSGSSTEKQSAPPVDPDRPTLHNRTNDSSSQTSSQSSDSGSSAPAPDPDRPTLHRSTDESTQSNAPAVDPDRPTLHRHATSDDNGNRETSTDTIDPNRPHLQYGRPENLETLDVPSDVEIAKLAAHPQNMEEMVAISDAATRQPQSFVYSWNDPADEKKAQAALETVAQKLLAGSAPTTFGTPAPTTHKTTRKPLHPLKPALPLLGDEQFKTYQLTFGGGATFVFSATSGTGDATRYITIIAQPDFNGDPQVLFKQITDHAQLDIVPRMKLIDAADTNADNRAELIFALEGTTSRQYAIYRVANGTVERVFTTGS